MPGKQTIKYCDICTSTYGAYTTASTANIDQWACSVFSAKLVVTG